MLYPSTLLVAFFAWSQVAIASNTQQLCFTHQTSVSPKGAVKTTSLIRSIAFTRPLTITTTPGTTVTPEAQNVAKRRRSLDRRARQVLKPRLLKPKPQTYYPDSVTCVGVVETIVYKAFTTATTYQATDYAICASNNYAGGANGKGIDDYDTNPALPFLGFTTDTSKEACCRSCAANPLCAGTAYYDPQAGGWRCQLIGTGSGQCSAGQYDLMAGQAQEFPVDQGLFVSNGKCAKWSSTY
ncbi:hypothetical protein SNOG_02802 [Parastagonospora nodorum SN15]|uniref:Apple domain-containing protein n=1 Tax=Phaeosphaeria nodorum (strain SN15 / ATCC MYA-4574 / FGSC 10173) TaxID=321614 RepID=Q0UZL2_PHANO|nr:hypothetical protein SNOG_02802 [Parastagonospora nodorum SN15]EAT89533.2 hypothetical protein SNOG_02802 [Parastagonospora nodorum SN15]